MSLASSPKNEPYSPFSYQRLWSIRPRTQGRTTQGPHRDPSVEELSREKKGTSTVIITTTSTITTTNNKIIIIIIITIVSIVSSCRIDVKLCESFCSAQESESVCILVCRECWWDTHDNNKGRTSPPPKGVFHAIVGSLV